MGHTLRDAGGGGAARGDGVQFLPVCPLRSFICLALWARAVINMQSLPSGVCSVSRMGVCSGSLKPIT
jgi:hypothetical protein